MEIRGLPIVVACFLSWIHFIESSEFNLQYELITDHTCDVPNMVPLPGPVRSVLECAASCLEDSNLCYNNQTSTCTCCSATLPTDPSTTKCYRQTGTCPDGWTKAGGLCLFAHSELVDLGECKTVCADFGGMVLTLENPEQASDALTFLDGKPGTIDVEKLYWFGVVGNTTETDRPWYYIYTEDVVAYFNWYPTEPNGHLQAIKENCVAGKYSVQWADVRCDWKLSCVCQIEL